jgi:hypothetical protein
MANPNITDPVALSNAAIYLPCATRRMMISAGMVQADLDKFGFFPLNGQKVDSPAGVTHTSDGTWAKPVDPPLTWPYHNVAGSGGV